MRKLWHSMTGCLRKTASRYGWLCISIGGSASLEAANHRLARLTLAVCNASRGVNSAAMCKRGPAAP